MFKSGSTAWAKGKFVPDQGLMCARDDAAGPNSPTKASICFGGTRLEYFPLACQVCKRSGLCNTPVKACGGCKRVYYCGTEHQKYHWNNRCGGGNHPHKKLCGLYKKAGIELATAAVCAVPGGPPDRKTWIGQLRTQALIMNALEAPAGMLSSLFQLTYGNADPALGLPWSFGTLHHHHYQPHCLVCFKQVELTPCPVCHCVAFCDDCNGKYRKTHTPEKCELHCVRLAAVIMAFENGNYLKTASKSRCAEKLPPNWSSYFRLKIADYDLPKELLALPAVAAQLTDGMSGIFTIIHTLQKVYAAEDARQSAASRPPDRSRVVLHVIDASVNDMIGTIAFEEVLHFFPECLNLTVVLCGTELGALTGDANGSSNDVSMHLCKGCKKRGCSLDRRTVKTSYHDAIVTGAIPTPSHMPTIAIAMNSGLHEKASGLLDLWEPTIKFLYESNAPTIYTAYTEDEIKADQEQIFSVVKKSDTAIAAAMGFTIDEKDLEKGVFMVPGTKNPYRSLLPMIDTFQDDEFFYNNQFYLVVYSPQGK